MKTPNRQHTIELWFNPKGGELAMCFTYKDWYWSDYADQLPLEHWRFPTDWGLVHILVYGVPVGMAVATKITTMVFDGKVKHTKFDDICGAAAVKTR